MKPSPARIRVNVAPASLAFERSVAFAVEGRVHMLVVDAEDVHGDLLRVTVVQEAGDDLLIELPRPSASGRFVRMPRGHVLAEPPGPEEYLRLGILLVAVIAGATVVFLLARAVL
jgi:hypothetical protein